MLFPFYSSQWETHPACSRESISGLCESSRRKSGLFSVADRCWDGLAKWRYNVSLTLTICEKSCFPKILTRNKNIDRNLFRLPIRCISRDCEPRDELWLSWKWAPMLHPAAELRKHGGTLREMCTKLKSQLTLAINLRLKLKCFESASCLCYPYLLIT